MYFTRAKNFSVAFEMSTYENDVPCACCRRTDVDFSKTQMQKTPRKCTMCITLKHKRGCAEQAREEEIKRTKRDEIRAAQIKKTLDNDKWHGEILHSGTTSEVLSHLSWCKRQLENKKLQRKWVVRIIRESLFTRENVDDNLREVIKDLENNIKNDEKNFREIQSCWGGSENTSYDGKWMGHSLFSGVCLDKKQKVLKPSTTKTETETTKTETETETVTTTTAKELCTRCRKTACLLYVVKTGKFCGACFCKKHNGAMGSGRGPIIFCKTCDSLI